MLPRRVFNPWPSRASTRRALVGVQEADRLAERDRLQLQRGVLREEDAARHHPRDRGPGHRGAVPAHQRRRLVAERLGERARPSRRRADQHVGLAALGADLEHGDAEAR